MSYARLPIFFANMMIMKLVRRLEILRTIAVWVQFYSLTSIIIYC